MVFSRIYGTDRFWCPTDRTIDLGDSGYLRDPESYTDWMGRSRSVPYEFIEDIPWLVLLGEPGIGKTLWFQRLKVPSKFVKAFVLDAGLRRTVAETSKSQ